MKQKWIQLLLGIIFFSTSANIAVAESGGGGHTVSPKAQTLFEIGPLPVTNSMVTCWVVCLIIVGIIQLIVGRPKLVPGKGQMIVEGVVDAVRNISGPIVGKKLSGPTFWLMSSLFIFILIHNWSGLFPGVGSIGWKDNAGHIVEPWIRPGNADLNMTLALALVSMGAWMYYIVRYAGPGVIAKDLFGNKADAKETPGPIYAFLFLVFGMVGIIEIVSICFRPISLTFRLFGNVFGGESLLHSMYALGHGMPGILSQIMPTVLLLPFYLLETLIGAVQALVFMLLVSVYIGLICNHGDDDHH